MRRASACSLCCIAALTAKKSSSPANVISPMRQSNSSIIAAMMPTVKNPLVVIITTRVATLAMFSMVLVVTFVTSPKLLSLNQPIGRYRRCSAISMRLFAHAR